MSASAVDHAAQAAPCVAIGYGSIAFHLPKPARGFAQGENTHKWSVFVRGADNQDITYAVSKVVFTLHHSFAQPVRGETGTQQAVAFRADLQLPAAPPAQK